MNKELSGYFEQFEEGRSKIATALQNIERAVESLRNEEVLDSLGFARYNTILLRVRSAWLYHHSIVTEIHRVWELLERKLTEKLW